jgi:hypothetical protein
MVIMHAIPGYDSYPNGFDCSHPTVWSPTAVPESFWSTHLQLSPNKPNAVYEFQGGAFDGWYVTFILMVFKSADHPALKGWVRVRHLRSVNWTRV